MRSPVSRTHIHASARSRHGRPAELRLRHPRRLTSRMDLYKAVRLELFLIPDGPSVLGRDIELGFLESRQCRRARGHASSVRSRLCDLSLFSVRPEGVRRSLLLYPRLAHRLFRLGLRISDCPHTRRKREEGKERRGGERTDSSHTRPSAHLLRLVHAHQHGNPMIAAAAHVFAARGLVMTRDLGLSMVGSARARLGRRQGVIFRLRVGQRGRGEVVYGRGRVCGCNDVSMANVAVS